MPTSDRSVETDLLIYDGDCGFCTTSARKFVDFVGESTTIAPWQAVDLDAYGLTEADCTAAAYFVDADGVAHRGADAFAHGLQTGGAPWSLLGKVLAVPPIIWVGRAVYPLIAKYRYKLPGATDACRLDLR